MIKGLDKVINNLKNIKKSSLDLNYLFIKKSLYWIANRANILLDERLMEVPHHYGSSARNWNYRIYGTYGFLENQDMNSAAIEFGIGLEGQESYNDIVSIANAEGYQYNVPSQYKDDDGYWTFYDPVNNIWIRFKGYVGKSFLYDAFCEYMQNKVWYVLYQEAFDETMRSVIR